MEIAVGRIYRAKKPGNSKGLVNDRQVIWTNGFELQYDGPAVTNGRHYPKVRVDKFLEWVGSDVTDQVPKGEWMDWALLKKAA